MKNKFPEELREEITTYLAEIKVDLESYLAWVMEEVNSANYNLRAAEVVEDTMHRLMTVSYYLATFFEDAEPAHVLFDLVSEISEEQGKDHPAQTGSTVFTDTFNRTRH
jgi:hypothetical protein